jgi:hypothetical protein
MEYIGEQEEIADGNKEYQSERSNPLVPDAPRLDATEQLTENGPIVEGAATRGDKSEQSCHHTFVATIHAKSERL